MLKELLEELYDHGQLKNVRIVSDDIYKVEIEEVNVDGHYIIVVLGNKRFKVFESQIDDYNFKEPNSLYIELKEV